MSSEYEASLPAQHMGTIWAYLLRLQLAATVSSCCNGDCYKRHLQERSLTIQRDIQSLNSFLVGEYYQIYPCCSDWFWDKPRRSNWNDLLQMTFWSSPGLRSRIFWVLKGFYISLNCLPEIECSKLMRFTTNEAIVRFDNSELCIEISGDDEKNWTKNQTTCNLYGCLFNNSFYEDKYFICYLIGILFKRNSGLT